MGLLDRYLAKEILLPFTAALVFLTQLLLATSLLSRAHILFGSGVSLVDVALIAVSLLPQLVGYVLPVAFLLGAVLGVGRLAEDREVVALGAAGISPVRLVRVPLALGVVVAALGVWFALEVEPASLAVARARLNDMVKRNVMNDVRPGTFYDQIPGYTIYAERTRGGRWENVLISDRSDPSSPVLALAGEGRLEPVGGGKEMRLVLDGGEVHREDATTDEYATAAFRHGELVIGLGTALTDRNSLARSSRGSTYAEARAAIDEARAAGKVDEARRLDALLHRRIAPSMAIVAFALLAVPLGASRRASRAFAITATFGVVIAQYLLMRSGEILSQKGRLPAWLGVELATVVLGLLAVALIAIQARRGAGAVR